MLKWLEPSSGAVCLITVEQSPLISHCSPICLLQMSNLHTGPSIIFIFHINTTASYSTSHKHTHANVPYTNLSKCVLVRYSVYVIIRDAVIYCWIKGCHDDEEEEGDFPFYRSDFKGMISNISALVCLEKTRCFWNTL